jgi:hypothetical protein
MAQCSTEQLDDNPKLVDLLGDKLYLFNETEHQKRLSDLSYSDILLLIKIIGIYPLEKTRCCKNICDMFKSGDISEDTSSHDTLTIIVDTMFEWLHQIRQDSLDMDNYKLSLYNVWHLEHFTIVCLRDVLCIYKRGEMDTILRTYYIGKLFVHNTKTTIIIYSNNQFLIYNTATEHIGYCYLCDIIDDSGTITCNKITNIYPWVITGQHHLNGGVCVARFSDPDDRCLLTIPSPDTTKMSKKYTKYQHETILRTNNGMFYVEINGTDLKITHDKSGNIDTYKIEESSSWNIEWTNGPTNDYIHVFDPFHFSYRLYDITDTGTKFNIKLNVINLIISSNLIRSIVFYCPRFMILKSTGIKDFSGQHSLHEYSIWVNSESNRWDLNYWKRSVGLYSAYIGIQDNKLIFATSPTKDGIPVMQYIDLIFT